MKNWRYHPFFIRLLHWEYWPFIAIYGPVLLYWFYLCLRSRSFFFFNTSNPTIGNGGFMMESKYEIYRLMPEGSYPRTILVRPGEAYEPVIQQIEQLGFRFPLVGKPDIGMKGMAVKKLEAPAELAAYLQQSPVDFLVQEFVPYENEVGIFYYRYPGEEHGHISGIVSKEFLTVRGDGSSTVLQLLQQDKRYVLQIPALRKSDGDGLSEVLAAGEEKVLVPYGNHVRGARFVDASHMIDEQLTRTIDAVCRQVDGFYFGRLDVRFTNWDDLRNGKNFSIIELNGAGSEPTHMYDPRHSIWFAWKEITRHWKILWRISIRNHRRLGKPFMSTGAGIGMLRANQAYIKLLHEPATA